MNRAALKLVLLQVRKMIFEWTWEGYVEALDHKICIEATLKTAKAAADKKGHKLYMPTVRESVEDCLDDPDMKAMKSLSDFKRHLKVLTKHCGWMLINTVSHVELREVIRAEHARGLSYESLRRLWSAVSKLFKWLFKQDRLADISFLAKVEIPTSARRDRRDRTLLEDDEFWALVECDEVPLGPPNGQLDRVFLRRAAEPRPELQKLA